MKIDGRCCWNDLNRKNRQSTTRVAANEFDPKPDTWPIDEGRNLFSAKTFRGKEDVVIWHRVSFGTHSCLLTITRRRMRPSLVSDRLAFRFAALKSSFRIKSGLMPTSRHFARRQAAHSFRVILFISQSPVNRQRNPSYHKTNTNCIWTIVKISLINRPSCGRHCVGRTFDTKGTKERHNLLSRPGLHTHDRRH